jgi:hypothetical protein
VGNLHTFVQTHTGNLPVFVQSPGDIRKELVPVTELSRRRLELGENLNFTELRRPRVATGLCD